MFTRGSAMPPSIPPLANAPWSRLTASSEALGSTGVFATLTRVPSCSASAASFEASSPKARICCTPSWRTASISAGGTDLPSNSNATPSWRVLRATPCPCATRTLSVPGAGAGSV